MGGTFLGRESMIADEAATWFFSSQPVSHMLRYSRIQDAVLLPYYLFMHFWLGISHSLWWMRLPSLLAGAVAVAALVWLGRRWLPLGWSVLAGFLLALNPQFVYLIMLARPYGAAALFAVLSTAALLRAIDRGGRRQWVLYGLASLCMVLLHVLSVFVLAAQLVGVAIARRRSTLPAMVATIGCVVVAVSPLAVVAAPENLSHSGSRFALGTFHEALHDISGGRVFELPLVICAVILIASLARTPRGSDRELGLALCLAWGVVPVLLLVLAGFLHYLYSARYALVCVPGVALIEAFGGWRLWAILSANARVSETSGRRAHALAVVMLFGRHGRWRWASVMAIITCGAACIAGLGLLARESSSLLDQPRFGGDDYPSAAATFSRDLSEHPAPVAVMPSFEGVGFSYYVNSQALAHALREPANLIYSQHKAVWSQASGVFRWPIGATSEEAGTRCAAGWAIGFGHAPMQTLIVDGSICRVNRVQSYGADWVASLGG